MIEQVHGILAGESISFRVGEDRRHFDVPVPQGSAEVGIDFETLGRGQTVIRLRANVLEAVETTDETRLEVLEHLNALNQSTLFGRFYLDADSATIVLEHELLGDFLDADELMNALYTVGQVADQTDDELQRSLGTGRRRIETPIEFDGAPASSWPVSGQERRRWSD